jgi:carbamoyltransferase
VQTVGPADDAFLRALLDHLEREGAPPCVLNTSLNRPGEPIADTAEQALAAARAMGLDAIVLGDDVQPLS